MSDPITADISKLAHNKLRLSYGSSILGRQLHEFQPLESAGLVDISNTTQINIPIASANPASFLNPAESMLKCRIKITAPNASTATADVNKRYIFKGVSSLIKSLQTSHATKSTVFENIENSDIFTQASKSLLDNSYWQNLCHDVDGSQVNSLLQGPNNVAPFNAAPYGTGLLADDSNSYNNASANEIKVYNADEVLETMRRTANRVVECEVPLPSGLLSSSNDSLIPLFNCPLKLTLNFNPISAAFKWNHADGAVTVVEVQFRYFACIYNMSDAVVANNNALIASSGLKLDYDRVQNVNIAIPQGTSSFSYSFPVMNISSLVAVMAVLVRSNALNSSSKDRYYFYDGSSFAQNWDTAANNGNGSGTASFLNSIQWSIGNQYFPQAPLQCGPLRYATLHTLSKSALLSDGGSVVYHTDSNHIQNYAGELDGVYKPGVADKFMMNMGFTHLNSKAYKSGLSLVNAPLNINMNFENATADAYTLQVFLLHQAVVELTSSDVMVKF